MGKLFLKLLNLSVCRDYNVTKMSLKAFIKPKYNHKDIQRLPLSEHLSQCCVNVFEILIVIRTFHKHYFRSVS